MSYDVHKNDVKVLASKIESLAKEIQNKLSANQDDILAVANELARNSTTFVFALGELYHAKSAQTSVKKISGDKIYKRDALGRFAR